MQRHPGGWHEVEVDLLQNAGHPGPHHPVSHLSARLHQMRNGLDLRAQRLDIPVAPSLGVEIPSLLGFERLEVNNTIRKLYIADQLLLRE